VPAKRNGSISLKCSGEEEREGRKEGKITWINGKEAAALQVKIWESDKGRRFAHVNGQIYKTEKAKKGGNPWDQSKKGIWRMEKGNTFAQEGKSQQAGERPFQGRAGSAKKKGWRDK